MFFVNLKCKKYKQTKHITMAKVVYKYYSPNDNLLFPPNPERYFCCLSCGKAGIFTPNSYIIDFAADIPARRPVAKAQWRL